MIKTPTHIIKSQVGRIEATACVLRDIITIILALAFTASIVSFLTTNGFEPIDVTSITLARVLSFLCVLSTIIRFYHGNVSYLNATYAVSDAEAHLRHYRPKLVMDFVIFFAQAMIFSALAIYQTRTRDFYALFVCLFVIDAVWCLVNVWFSGWTFRPFEGSRAHQHLFSQMNWLLANAAAAGLLAGLLAFRWTASEPEMQQYVPHFFAVIALNAVFDYWRNRRLYFPVGLARRHHKVAFVGARFTSAITPSGFDPELRKLIQAAHEVARSHHLTVRSAHEEERFGDNLAKPEELARRDLEEIAEADLFIGLWDKAVSPGMLIEIGWASALHKDIVIMMPLAYDTMQNPMLKGLSEITNVKIVRYDGTVPSLEDGLQKALSSRRQ